ncbi:MAG: lamin tail domain-containing protein [Salinivirgaceae bacterium]|nr:lamin tail domain-containing protein [Salinivirgaceae bacterium]
MKQLLLSMLAVAFVGTILAQDCSELFFSEYVEGSNNNKALEIYNPTKATISLSDYQMARYDNGALVPNYVSFPAGTEIAANSVLVVALDKRDPSGIGQDTMLFAELIEKADIFLCPVYNVNKMMYFNGDDAVTLERKSNGVYIDIIGRIGEDPGLGWNDNADNEFFQTEWFDPSHWTYNNTMVRKRTIKKGVSTNPNFFNPSVEWDTIGNNVFTNLGIHDCECGAVSIPVNTQENLIIYPNPVANGTVTLQASKTIVNVDIYNVIGQLIITNKFDGSMAKVVMDVNVLNSGLYVAKVVYSDNTSSTRKVQIK